MDKVTGLSFPIHRSFPYAGKSKIPTHPSLPSLPPSIPPLPP